MLAGSSALNPPGEDPSLPVRLPGVAGQRVSLGLQPPCLCFHVASWLCVRVFVVSPSFRSCGHWAKAQPPAL